MRRLTPLAVLPLLALACSSDDGGAAPDGGAIESGADVRLDALGDAPSEGAVDAGADASDGGGAPAFCTNETPTVGPSGAGFLATTTHYALYDEVSSADATEVARLLEASFGAFASWFERPSPLGPNEKLSVKLYKDQQAWATGLQADGITPPQGAGGYYSPTTKAAYLYKQGNPYYSHVLAVHEATHQYHYLSRVKINSLPFWYVEGVAEYLSRHDWDGSCVRLGVGSLLSWEDLPAKVTGPIDVAGILGGSVTPSRAESWAIVRYLDTGTLKKPFGTWRDAYDATGTADFKTLVADPATLGAPIGAWLPSAQEPMKPIFTEWIHVGPASVDVSTPTFFSQALVKTSVTHFEAKLEVPQSNKFTAGVVVGFQDSTHYMAVLQANDGSVSTFTANGSAAWNGLGSAPLPSNKVEVISADWAGGMATVSFNGTPFTVTPATPLRAGLAASDTTARFIDVSWK